MIDSILDVNAMELTDEQLEAVSGAYQGYHWGGQPSWYSGEFGGFPTYPSSTTTHS